MFVGIRGQPSINSLLESYGQNVFGGDKAKKQFRRRRMLINCVKEVASFLNGPEETTTATAIKILDAVRQDMRLTNVNKFQEGKYIPSILDAAREKLNSPPPQLEATSSIAG